MEDVPLRILLLVLLTLCNAFFAAAEIALLQINETRYKKLAEEGDKKAKKIVKMLSNSANFLSTIQVGVTLSGFLSSAFAADSFADALAGLVIKGIPTANRSVIRVIAVIAITFLLSYFTLVFGELVPKRLAMKKCDRVARFSVGPLRFTGIVFLPFVKLLSGSVNLVLRILGIDPNEKDDDVTEEEILLMVNEGQEQGNIDDDESELINNVFEFDDTTCGDIMIHRTEIVALPEDVSFERLIEVAKEERYSRIPVFRDSIDNIVGIIHIKSLIGLDAEHFDIKNMLLPVVFVPESQKIDDVLDVLKKNKSHLAVVLDEFGGTAGIITMEDIIEELVGTIQDEYDDQEELTENLVEKTGENEYTISGHAEIDGLNDELGIEIESEDYNTLSGFAVDMLGEIPPENSHPEFTYKNLRFTVLESSNKLITKLKLEILPENDEDEEDSHDKNDKD
ncbi:MAG: HlyC/CorC family transporter [Clostridia bacterium]|nr:HlyC/CorC family transporter [Clostridia bacterium]MBP5665299.1 HlyC/CorC family transporter [Clostridia bacterium]